MTHHTLKLGTITYWAGGYDRTPGRHRSAVGGIRGDWTRLDALPDIVRQGPLGIDGLGPRILFVQQANWFDRDGSELRYYTERLLRPFGRYRSYLSRSDWNVSHCVTFIREAVGREADIDVLHHWDGHDPDEEADRYGFTEVQVGGDNGPVLWLRGAMFYPRSAARRVEMAKSITGAVPDDVTAILAGSFNSPFSGPGEPERDWDLAYALDPESALHKGRVLPDGSIGPDTSTTDHFIGAWSEAAAPLRRGGAGWFSLGQLDGDLVPTVHHEVDKGGPLRINDVLASRDILVPGSHTTHPVLTHAAKKHRYVTVSVTV